MNSRQNSRNSVDRHEVAVCLWFFLVFFTVFLLVFFCILLGVCLGFVHLFWGKLCLLFVDKFLLDPVYGLFRDFQFGGSYQVFLGDLLLLKDKAKEFKRDNVGFCSEAVMHDPALNATRLPSPCPSLALPGFLQFLCEHCAEPLCDHSATTIWPLSGHWRSDSQGIASRRQPGAPGMFLGLSLLVLVFSFGTQSRCATRAPHAHFVALCVSPKNACVRRFCPLKHTFSPGSCLSFSLPHFPSLSSCFFFQLSAS